MRIKFARFFFIQLLPIYIILFFGANAFATIIDNTNIGFSVTGTWGASSFTPGFYGSNYQFSPPGSGTRQAKWSFPVSSGQYELSARWAAFENRASNAFYRVYNNGIQIGTQVFDQRFNGGQFNAFNLNYSVVGGTLDVVLTDNADGYVIADALQTVFLGAGGNLAPNSVINTPSSNVTITAGSSVNFTGTGTDSDNNLPLRYLWNFGAGSGIQNSALEDPGSLIFSNPGIFTVTFTVTDNLLLSDPTPATVVVTVNPSSSQIIVDNTTPGFSTVGIWGTSSFTPGFYGSNYAYAPPGTGSRQAKWSFPVTSGLYQVSAQWAAFDNRASNAFYRVYNNGIQIGTQVFDQRFNGGQYNVFNMTYAVVTGTMDVLVTDAADGYVIADAVKLVRLGTGGNLSPNGVINSPSSNVSISVGDAVSFSGAGADPDNNLPLSYLWSFGSGSGISDTFAENPGPRVFNNPGTFTVNFTVTDGLGLPDPTPATIVVSVSSPSSQLIIDNTNAGFSTVGTWGTSSSTPGYYGIDYRYIAVSPGANKAIWSINLAEGKYDIYAQWAAFENRASNAKYTVFSNGKEFGNYWADQRFDGGQFNSLGVFYLEGGPQQIVLSELVTMNGIIIADAVKFENRCQSDPCVYLKTPQDYHLQVSGVLAVAANVQTVNPISQYGVRFFLDKGTSAQQEVLDLSYPFNAVFNVSVPSLIEHNVDAYLTNSVGASLGGVNGHDDVINVGIGNYYVTMGDSTTNGVGDDDIIDDISIDMRNGGGGFPPILNDLLTAQSAGVPHNIVNEGVPGTLSADGAAIVSSLLQKHLLAQRFLAEYGINDSGAFPPVPSGLGLARTHPNYPGTFKDNMQKIIDAVNLKGKQACLAKAPIILGDQVDSAFYPDPDTGSRNIRIKEYNQVIDELVSDPSNKITVTPPDFYAKFNEIVNSATGERRYELEYHDNYHMNGIGYRTKANEWRKVLSGN